jgi:mono/diheme cytochrome c family protein
MKKSFIFLVIAAFIIYACTGSEAKESSDSSATAKVVSGEQNEEIDGEKTYKQYCVVCHGLYGDMGASGAFNLKTSELNVEERVQVITNGRNAMTPFKSLLSEEKIQAVAKYTMTLNEGE